MIETERSKTLDYRPKYAACVSILVVALASAMFTISSNASDTVVMKYEKFTKALETTRSEMDLPGLRAAIRLSDGTVIQGAVGWADVATESHLDNVAPMPGGSTGKIFVAALTMLLEEEGTLSLDDLASKWLEDLPWFDRLPNAHDIRVWHLLSHTSGMSDYPDSRSYQFQSIWRAIRRGSVQFEPEELIRFTLRKRPLFPVGQGFGYTDIGFLVLGKLIEAASDRQYYDLLQEKIFIPLSLDQILPQDKSILPGVVTGYTRGAPNLREDGRMKFDPSSEWTGGGLAFNPTMLVEFLGALAELRVVNSDSFKKMLDMGWRDPDSPGEHYGLGLFVNDEQKTIGHAGLWPGYRTDVLHYLSSNTTIAVQTNRDGPVDTQELIRRVALFADIDLSLD
ncbi:MAG: serine hydrolase [Gammaproteobacteria bacterium]|nr:serine hydrolase [Gammaproteobacteria bacterium]